MRLTPEREAEIRECPFDCGYGCLVEKQELFAEIDELRVEKNRLRPCRGCPTVKCTCFSELEDDLLYKLDDVLKERDQLKWRLDKLREAARKLLSSEALKEAPFYNYSEAISDGKYILAADDEMEGK